MKLFDGKLELRVLRSVLEGEARSRYKVMGSINEGSFHTSNGKELYARILALYRQQTALPKLAEITHDPVLSDALRKTVERLKPFSSESSKRAATRTLDQYKKLRTIYLMAEHINDELSKDKVDVAKLSSSLTNTISGLNKGDHEDEIFHIGKDGNLNKLVKDMLKGGAPKLVPTGFDAFDRENGGIAFGSLFTMAGTTGGGKTSTAIQIGMNMANAGHDVAYIPLEMGTEEMMERVLSNISGVSLNYIKQKKLKTRQKKKIYSKFKSWQEKLDKKGTKFTIFSPYEGITLEEALFAIGPLKPRVLILDYVGLLKLTGSEDQWQQLSKAAWLAKTYAKATDSVVILLAQLGEDGALRYSKAIGEHSNNAWYWVVTPESREQKIMNIKQAKARNQKMFDFTLGFDDDCYRVFDVDEHSAFTDRKEPEKSDEKVDPRSQYMDAHDE